jgi:hypothetical protein
MHSNVRTFSGLFERISYSKWFIKRQVTSFEEIQYYQQGYNEKLYISDGLSPRFYGLPKIPLRPIVSFVNSATYGVSSFLAKILPPVVGNTENTVKNSYHFSEFVRGKLLKQIKCWYHLMSFPCLQLTSQLISPSRLRQKD